MFLGKDFDMDFLQKYLRGVLERPLPRNALKRTKNSKKKSRKNRQVGGGRVGLGFRKGMGVRRFLFVFCPSAWQCKKGPWAFGREMTDRLGQGAPRGNEKKVT
jgi:hypothetical protein